jgi:glycosyltransferase involved in cell wall biosynthesis
MAKSLLNLYDTYIALTPLEKDIVARKLGLLSDKITVIPNGVDPPKLTLNKTYRNKRNSKILYLGRISREKNIPLLIKAMKYVVKEITDAKLVLVGPDEGLIKWIYNYINKQDLKHAVIYLGSIYGERKFRLYVSSDVYALPSLYEAFAITTLEAGIVGTPSVITGYGGQLYTAPPGIASLWAKPTPKDFSKAIITILNDGKMQKRLAEGAKKHAEKFVWNRILPMYEKLYDNIIKDG